MNPISFFIPGVAKPSGSKRGFYIKSLNRVVITDANPNSKDWKTDVKYAARAAYRGPALDGPIAVAFNFAIARPKSHYRTGKNAHLLKDGAPKFPASKPDVLKLSRGVEDALTGILWVDDAQIVTEYLTKRYSETPGVFINVMIETK